LHAQHAGSTPVRQSHTVIVLHGEGAAVAITDLLGTKSTISHAVNVTRYAGACGTRNTCGAADLVMPITDLRIPWIRKRIQLACEVISIAQREGSRETIKGSRLGSHLRGRVVDITCRTESVSHAGAITGRVVSVGDVWCCSN